MASSTAVWYCWLDAWVSAAAIVVGFGTHTSVWFRLLSFHTPTCPATAEHAVASDCSSSSSGSITVSVAQTLILAYHALLLGFVVSGSKWYRKEDNRNVLVLGLRLFCVVHAITRMVLEGAHFPPVDGATASQLSMSSAWRTFLLLVGGRAPRCDIALVRVDDALRRASTGNVHLAPPFSFLDVKLQSFAVRSSPGSGTSGWRHRSWSRTSSPSLRRWLWVVCRSSLPP